MAKLGCTLLNFETVGSTNDLARRAAVQGAEEGVVIIAREQTAGRGSKGRSWSSPAGQGLYLSIILRPTLSPSNSTVITLAAAVAVCETLIAELGIEPDIKWPNDVLLNGRKVCGILVESATEKQNLQYAILGIGINLTQQRFPPELQESATSLLLETGREIVANDLIGPLMDQLEIWYRGTLNSAEPVLAGYRRLSSFVQGSRVRVFQSEGAFEAVTRGLTPTGALIVETLSGETKVLVSGEIHKIRGTTP